MSQKALFLDRDGVINIEKNYIYKIKDFEFIEGIFELCLYFQKLGFIIIVVTNQSGIARGMYSQEDFLTLTSWMKDKFKEQGIKISEVYFCPHHPDISGECSCRKPLPGMLIEAEETFNLDLENSLLVGDSERDIQAAKAAGIKKTYLYSQNLPDSSATKVVSSLNEIIKAYHD